MWTNKSLKEKIQKWGIFLVLLLVWFSFLVFIDTVSKTKLNKKKSTRNSKTKLDMQEYIVV